MTYALPQSLHPLLPFLVAAGRHPVHGVFPFDDFAFRISLAGFDEVRTAASVQFEAKLFLSVGALSYRNVLERNDTTRFFVGRVLEIVEAIVVEDEPTPLPTLVATTLFPKPAFFVGIEERVHEIVAVVLGNFERFRFYTFV